MKYQREVTALVLIPAVLATLVYAPVWAFTALVGLATGAALVEFYRLVESAGWVVPKFAGYLLFLGLVVAALQMSSSWLLGLSAAAFVLLPTLVMFSAPPEAVLLPSSAASVFATLYVALGAASTVALRARGWRAVLFLLVIVWAGDTAAYYTGRKWGKRKLAPVVSPKKTWAGFWGQLGAGAVFGLALGLSPLGLGLFPGRPVLEGLATAFVGLVLSVVAVVGDLVESTFKRSVQMKDSGGLLPGHGGLLDRLDSLLYASPVLLSLLLLLDAAKNQL